MARRVSKDGLASVEKHTFGREGHIAAINLRVYITILKIRREMPGNAPMTRAEAERTRFRASRAFGIALTIIPGSNPFSPREIRETCLSLLKRRRFRHFELYSCIL